MYLLDTNVVSELRRPRPHGGLVAWLESVSNGHSHLSAETVGKIQSGIDITPERGRDEAWLDRWRRLQPPGHGRANRPNVGPHHAPKSDWLIEDATIATAAVHGLTVATPNVSAFKGFGVRTFNPFTRRPA
jgi:toxin FitB